MKKIITILFLGIITLHANLLPRNFYKFDNEFKAAEQANNVSFFLLKAIAMTENEGFNPDIKRLNSNNTYDYGLMQVNTIWLDTFNVSENRALTPKHNINMSAKILSGIINQHGYSWEAIGRYHSATGKYKKVWLARLKKNLIFIIKNDSKYNYVIES